MALKRILIQAGHLAPREPGFEGGTGTTREIEFTSAMRGALSKLFQRDGRFDVTLNPGDITDGWRGDVALYLHGDGSANAGSHGFSFGWPAQEPGHAPVLAKAITAGFIKIGHPGGHHPDNYTGALRFYYGYRRTSAPTELLIEHGFLTNPTERAWMFAHIDEMAKVEYEAVVAHLGLPPKATAGKLLRGPLVAVDLTGKRIASGYLNNPLTAARFVQAITTALRMTGHRAPWVARVAGVPIATGKFWPLGSFSRTVAREARRGSKVIIDRTVAIIVDTEGR